MNTIGTVLVAALAAIGPVACIRAVPYDGTTWNMDPSPLVALGPNYSHHTFISAANGGVEIGYTVAVPNSYATSPNKRYPVIHALHGIMGDEVSTAVYYASSVFNIAGTARHHLGIPEWWQEQQVH